jgi:hypothetical protein
VCLRDNSHPALQSSLEPPFANQGNHFILQFFVGRLVHLYIDWDPFIVDFKSYGNQAGRRNVALSRLGRGNQYRAYRICGNLEDALATRQAPVVSVAIGRGTRIVSATAIGAKTSGSRANARIADQGINFARRA